MVQSADPIHGHKLVLGTVQFGLEYGISNQEGKTSTEEVSKILKAASVNGIHLLDTAYGYGTSEEALGQVLPPSTFEIVSKFPKTDQSGDLLRYLQESLGRLNVTNLYGYLAHDADTLIRNPALWDELVSLRTNGIVSRIGYSLYTPAQLIRLLESNMIPDLVQVPYNVFDQRFEPLLIELKKLKTEVHVRSAFLQGLFFMTPDSLPSFFDRAKPFLAEIQRRYPSAETLSGALLYFCMDNPLIDRVVVGVNNAGQLEQNLASLRTVHPIADGKNFQLDDESILLPYHWPKR